MANGESVGIIRQISGSQHVLLSAEDQSATEVELDYEMGSNGDVAPERVSPELGRPVGQQQAPDAVGVEEQRPKAIFLGHGRKVGPREKLERILGDFKIPFLVAISEPNLGKPIPTKVRETMLNCGSAILVFTKDQKFYTDDSTEVWRPSENVVHELGAASLLYEDRIVIFKERGIDLPSNFSSIGYIEFDEDGIEAKAVDLLKELIGFGLVTVSPTV